MHAKTLTFSDFYYTYIYPNSLKCPLQGHIDGISNDYRIIQQQSTDQHTICSCVEALQA